MTAAFADTFYHLALLDPDDAAHRTAVALSEAKSVRTVTTAWVLTEVADALCLPPRREALAGLLAAIRADPWTGFLPAEQDQFERGFALYVRRPDRAWSLTDCISFVVMTERGLTETLTGDHHFVQAGFRAQFRR